jgi:hypothetical protein
MGYIIYMDNARLDEINKEIANGNNDPKLFNELEKILGLNNLKAGNYKKGTGKHLAGWKVKKQ